MKTITKLLLSITLIGLLFACGSGRKEERAYSDVLKTDSTAIKEVSSSAAVVNKKDTIRKFIRTADLKFKVKSVINSTYAIENIISKQGGFVTYTQLNSTIDNKTTVAISADSSLETIYYSVVNNMTLRVPTEKLDTTLKIIAQLIDYLDYRTIKADDVALQLLSNKLTQQRTQNIERRITKAIDNRGKKLRETTSAEELLASKQEQSDVAKVSNLSLNDQINYSTITLSIYQRQALKRELIANEKNIDIYTPGLGSKLLEALKTGWEMLEAIFVFFAQLWWFLLFVAIGYLIYRISRKRLNK
ncbi:MAG: DUF4349 domain-containing protein [Bacteroidota bacterium]